MIFSNYYSTWWMWALHKLTFLILSTTLEIATIIIFILLQMRILKHREVK